MVQLPDIEVDAGRPARLLVVDDDEANLVLLRHMLARSGYPDVILEQDSRAVVEQFKRHQPDLVLLDLHMPAPDGYALLHELRSLVAPDDLVPLVVLTADVSVDAKERALGLGAHDLITKPFNFVELELRVRNCLALRARNLELSRRAAAVAAELDERVRAEREHAMRWRDARGRIEAVLADRGIAMSMAFQPIVDMADGSIIGAEALARFPAGSDRGPDLWFAEAAEVGLGVDLELQAIELALAGLAALPDNAFLSMNASVQTIMSPAFRELLSGRSDLGRLVVELTEHDQVHDYDGLEAVLSPLRARGLRFAVDDIGNGWSSLQHILRLAPDVIKLDRALIVGVDHDPSRRALVASMLHFAAEIGSSVVAEGIETVSELTTLRDLGVRKGQGYLIAAPTQLPVVLSVQDGLLVDGQRSVEAGTRAASTDIAYRQVFRQSPGLFLLLDPGLRILDATDGYLAATMTDRRQIVGRHLFEAFPDNPEDPDATGSRNLGASLDRVRRRKVADLMAVQKYDVRRPGDDGSGFEARYWSPLNVPVLSRGGVLQAIVHRVEDVTELVRLRDDVDPTPRSERRVTSFEEDLFLRGRELEEDNDRLKALDRVKSEFLSRMSHELRTPLNAVIGFAQVLAMEELTSEQDAALDHILRAGRHLLDLINEVLDISQIEAGVSNLSIEPVQVCEIVTAAVALAEPMAERSGIPIHVSPAGRDDFVMADRQRLLQILLNLLSNAIKYNRPDGAIAVRSEVAGDRVRLYVTDQGRGIADDDVHRLFEPFDRLGKEQTDIEGTGVGLTLARGLAERMNGSLELRATGHAGSTFVLDVPVAQRPVVGDEPPLDVTRPVIDLVGPARPMKVLYVEDNLSNLRLVESVLRKLPGVTLLSAMQGRLGYELAVDQRPDLVLLDVHLPDIDGGQVLALLRADPATVDTTVVFLSADATPRHVQRLLAAGADGYLTKPFQVSQLVQVVEAARAPRRAEAAAD